MEPHLWDSNLLTRSGSISCDLITCLEVPVERRNPPLGHTSFLTASISPVISICHLDMDGVPTSLCCSSANDVPSSTFRGPVAQSFKNENFRICVPKHRRMSSTPSMCWVNVVISLIYAYVCFSELKRKFFSRKRLPPSTSKSQNEMEGRAALELVIGCRLVIDPVFRYRVRHQLLLLDFDDFLYQRKTGCWM